MIQIIFKIVFEYLGFGAGWWYHHGCGLCKRRQWIKVLSIAMGPNGQGCLSFSPVNLQFP
jgi:hypothetical protein